MDDDIDLEALRAENIRRAAELTADNERRVFSEVMARPLEDRLTQDREWFRERDQRWAAERVPKQHERETAIDVLTRRLAALEQRIDDDRRALSQMLGEEVGTLLADNNSDFADQISMLRRETVALTETIVLLTDISNAERMGNASDTKVVSLRRSN